MIDICEEVLSLFLPFFSLISVGGFYLIQMCAVDLTSFICRYQKLKLLAVKFTEPKHSVT